MTGMKRPKNVADSPIPKKTKVFSIFDTAKHNFQNSEIEIIDRPNKNASTIDKPYKRGSFNSKSFSSRFVDITNTEYPTFQMANGSKDHIKEVKSVTPAPKKDTAGVAASVPGLSKKDSLHVVTEAKPKPPSTPPDPNDLKNHPALKHLEEHIVDHIQREILNVNNNVNWDAVAGLDQVKKSLREIVVLPFLRKELFTGIRAPPKGVLLFGPPGTGKTLIAKCVANQAKATFFNVSVSTMTSKWVGEGEKLVRALFDIARLKLPSIIFIDEIDSLLSARKDGEHESSRRMKTEFLVQMDGISTNSDERLLVLGATNKPEEIDEAARRRFPKRLYIPLPEFEAREKMVQMLLQNESHKMSSKDFKEIAELTKGFSGADMYNFAKEAAYGPIREVIEEIETIPIENIRPIVVKDFVEVLGNVKPTVLESELQSYLDWDKTFGCHSKS
uniref:AAA+ ATPase domain-containing protein n=1 Tax=Panagrolaimus sp. JU765 TaxID=591449 RepID=A0AC34QVE5_9BILA